MKQLKWLMVLITAFLLGCGSSSDKASQDDTQSVTIPLRVACVGDSITEGFQLTNPSTESYPAQLSEFVSDGVDVKNFGIRGRTLIKIGDPSYWNTEEYKQSLAFNPEVVVIMLGTNDMKDVNFPNRNNIISDYTALIESYKLLSSKPIIYICYPPPSYGKFRGITNKRIVDVLIPMLREVSIQNNVNVIDIHTLLSNKKELFPDTLHPNKEGARQMAELVYQTIY